MINQNFPTLHNCILIPVVLFPVLHRCHGNTQLRLQQNHNVQDEVLNPSSLLSTSRHTPDFRFVLPLLHLSTLVPKLCLPPKASKDTRMRNRLSSLDCCAFAPPAILSTDETEFKGQPVEAPFIANLFALVPPSLNLHSPSFTADYIIRQY